MSRIHEALKKAEQERAGVQVTEPGPMRRRTRRRWKQLRHFRRAVQLLSLSLRKGSRQRRLVPPLSGEYLRFDDLRAHCAHPEWHLDSNVNVFFNPGLSPHGAEQFRTLRSRLYQIRANQPLRTRTYYEFGSGRGENFHHFQFGAGHCPPARPSSSDYRCGPALSPAARSIWARRTRQGLTDYLRGEADEMTVIQHGQEDNLCFIAGGTQVKDPSELLSNGMLKKLLDRVTPVFDWVLLDSPPCLPVADATMLADLCDGVLLVVQAGKTASEVAQKACQELQGKNVVGVVLNAVEESHLYGTYYYQAMVTAIVNPRRHTK